MKLVNEAADEIEALRERIFWINKYRAAREDYLEEQIKIKNDLVVTLEEDMLESQTILNKNLQHIIKGLGTNISVPEINQAWETIVAVVRFDEGK